jgi:hypothetical protein
LTGTLAPEVKLLKAYLRGYSGSPIAILWKHNAEWLFPQEKATFHRACWSTLIGEPL